MAFQPRTPDRHATGGLHKVQLYVLHCDPAPPFMVLDFRPSNSKNLGTDPSMWGNVYGLPFTTPDGELKFSRGRQSGASEEACQIQHAPLFFKLLDTLGHQNLVILMQVVEVLNDALLPGHGWSIVANNSVTAGISVDPAESCQQRFKILLQMFMLNNTPRSTEVKRPVSGMMAYCIYVPQEHNTLLRDKHWVDSAAQRHQDRYGGTIGPRERRHSSAMVSEYMDITPRLQHCQDGSDINDRSQSPDESVLDDDEEDVVLAVSSPTYSPTESPVCSTTSDADVEPSPKRKRAN
ncbi:hypothetical protein EV426DRAFT_644974 [Tirmania nivea]|nr:hypothetical protein EV426DRAFT_644974 [Tirmania nivea]